MFEQPGESVYDVSAKPGTTRPSQTQVDPFHRTSGRFRYPCAGPFMSVAVCTGTPRSTRRAAARPAAWTPRSTRRTWTVAAVNLPRGHRTRSNKWAWHGMAWRLFSSLTGAIFSQRPGALEAWRASLAVSFEANALGAKGDGPGQGVDAGSNKLETSPLSLCIHVWDMF